MPIPDPQVLPGEHTKLQFKVSSVYVDIAQLLNVKPPGGSVDSVPTTGLASVAQTFRPSLIPGVGEVTFTFQYDPNLAAHITLGSRTAIPALDDFTVVYVDGYTTPAHDQFFGFVTKFELNEVEGESPKNLEASMTVQVTGVVTRTPGVTP